MNNIYLGRQPIVDGNANTCAYEILYRDKSQESNMSSDRHASASVINNVLNSFGTKELLGKHRAFINIDEKFLMHDIIFTIPSEFFIFSLFNDIAITDKTRERIQQLKSKGYQLCINDMKVESVENYASVLKEITYVKISFEKEVPENTKELIKLLKNYGIIVIGTKIETIQSYQYAKENGCEWFEGYFFAAPKIVEKASYQPSQLHILKLYNLLLQDTNIDEITKEFEQNHELTVNLLQFINSGYFSFKNRISSIHHVLMLVGRVPLSQWLMLMIYSKSVSKDDNSKSPLMLMVKNRTELMQNILKSIKPDARSNMLGEAYFIGVISLISAILGVELSTILEDLHVSDEVKNAVLLDEGILGEIFALVRAIESLDTHVILEFEKRHSLDSSVIKNIILKTIQEVNSFEHHQSA
jgi:EAL and modified HD-GYP domain-containing signal transduction protein